MKLNDYAKIIKDKITHAHQTAKNPFVDGDYTYNPFKSVFNRTYVWIEEEDEPLDITLDFIDD